MEKVTAKSTGKLGRRWAWSLPALVLVSGLVLAPVGVARAGGDIATQTVKGKFNKVIASLKREIAGHKLVIIKQIPYRKMLAMVGTKSEPLMGFEIFHPRFGKVIYKADVNAFKEVPLRILLRGTKSGVVIQYHKPSVVFASYPGLTDLGKQLDGVFADIVKRLAK